MDNFSFLAVHPLSDDSFRRSAWIGIVTAGTAITLSCNPQSTQPAVERTVVMVTDHFRVSLTPGDIADSSHIRTMLEDNYSRILTDLHVDTLPQINIAFLSSGTAFRTAVGMPSLPSWVVGIASGPVNVYMVSPRSPDAGQPFNSMIQILVHEFTHCVTLNMNPTFANNPRWLWEGVSMYEAGQFQHPSAITGWPNELPTLAQLNANWQTNTDVYASGYVIVEYVVQTWGTDSLALLVKSNGNVQQTLGVSVASFEDGWGDFLLTKFGSP